VILSSLLHAPHPETVVFVNRLADCRLPASWRPEVRIARLPPTIPAGGRKSVPARITLVVPARLTDWRATLTGLSR